ncbi:hypothetical protein GW17_00016506 [Ensete ventricosum]|nr:hypothetical protein GW17_00016506 [Ensete ventricosum]RZR78578.1 hypothetical protein BHM03_00003993 [Ensete ventricosum]
MTFQLRSRALLLQSEKQVLALLSRLDLQHVHFVESPPGMFFIEKAPEEVVRGVREKASNAEEKITLTKNRLAFLQSTVSSSV